MPHERSVIPWFSNGLGQRLKSDSKRWVQRQRSDPYVKQSQVDGYRARSAYKLIEMNEKLHFLPAGAVVIECGARPGAWTQVAVEKVSCRPSNKPGLVVAVDIEQMDDVDGAIVLDNTDMLDNATPQLIKRVLSDRPVDVVLSDMAPNASRNRELDHARIMDLCRAALSLAVDVLREGGVFLTKAWDGKEVEGFMGELHGLFTTVKRVKPRASRDDSSEFYFYAKGFQPHKRQKVSQHVLVWHFSFFG